MIGPLTAASPGGPRSAARSDIGLTNATHTLIRQARAVRSQAAAMAQAITAMMAKALKLIKGIFMSRSFL